jgi:hypothetical protein
VVGRNTVLTVSLTAATIETGKLRLAGSGHYRPTEGSRGDLIIEIQTDEGWRLWTT